jgi:hypothetical protein
MQAAPGKPPPQRRVRRSWSSVAWLVESAIMRS